MNQRYYHASAGATLNLTATKYKPHVASWERATLFFATDAKFTVRTSGDSLTTGEQTFEAKDEIQVMETKAHMTKLNYTFPNATTKTRLYGVALDGARGVALDNYSMRGTPGFMLSKIPVKTMQEINKYRPYDLIILQFGLNVVNDKATDAQCRAYINRMKTVIENFKKAFPNTSIVVFSVPDRVQRSAGGIHTLKGGEAGGLPARAGLRVWRRLSECSPDNGWQRQHEEICGRRSGRQGLYTLELQGRQGAGRQDIPVDIGWC